MSSSKNILQGLGSSIFDNDEKKFEREQEFGKKLYITAWAVEIMAATIGLIIAGMMAWDAYNNSDVKNASASMNALLGALPFLLIAVIEPTKIPLATGLYRVKNWGWKTLIALSLVGLTGVTFETLFTGLERQVTNVTSTISIGKDEIQNNQEKIASIVDWLEKNENVDITEKSADLNKQRDNNLNDLRKSKADAESSYRKEKNSLNERRQDRLLALNKLEKTNIELENKALKPLEDTINNAKEKLNQAKAEKSRYEDSKLSISDTNQQDPLISKLNDQIRDIRANIDDVNLKLNSNEEVQIKKAQIEIGVTDDGKVGPNTLGNFQEWKAPKEKQIENLNNQIKEKIKANQSQIDNEKEKIEEKLKDFDNKIDELQKELDTAQNDFKKAQVAASSKIKPKDPQQIEIENELSLIGEELKALDERFNRKIKDLEDDYNLREKTLESEFSKVNAEYASIKADIPEQKKAKKALEKSIQQKRQILRGKAQESQIYRFAKKTYGHEDILDVNERELTRVAAVWFGSIALVCATVGTMLALISCIMMDPDAFVEKTKTRRNNRLNRSLRKLSLAIRKKILVRPKIVQIEVPTEIEKIVEVEKIVEKIVEKPIREEVDKLVPEIVPIPIFVPNGGDPQAELDKVAGHYEAINEKVKSSFESTARKHEDYDKGA